jgi:hypothetical protein
MANSRQSESSKNSESRLDAFVLYEHRYLSQGRLVAGVLFRVASLITTLLLIFLPSLSKPQVFGALALSFLMSNLWYLEERTLVRRLYRVEELLSRVIAGPLEDEYIRWRYESSYYPSIFNRFLMLEPFFWLLAAFVAATFRLDSMPKG